MQLGYKFYFGGDKNPFSQEEEEAYSRITAEREAADPRKEKPIDEIFPTLDSWADYLIAHSKSVFWEMERAISKNGSSITDDIEEFWEEARRNSEIGEWLRNSEADESTKALCFYMASLHQRFCPGDLTVDFRYYITEGRKLSPPQAAGRIEEEVFE